MRRLFFILTFLCCLVLTLTAETSRESMGSSSAAILESANHETVQIGNGSNSVDVLSSTDTETVLQFNTNKFEKTKVDINGEEWFDLRLPKEGMLLDKGFPQLPVCNRSIIIGNNALMKTEIFDIKYEDIKLQIAPSKGDLTRDIDPATVPYTFDQMYEKDEFYPKQIATLSEPYIMRDFRGIVVRTVPFAYNPVTQTLRIYTSYKVRVYADGIDNVNVLTTTREGISRAFLEVYENHFLNWENYRYTSVSDAFGTLLIIYYDSFEDQIRPLYEWKRQKGIYTYFVPFSDVGTTAAHLDSYIQTYYSSYSVDFVLLVGDAAQIPTLDVGGGGSDPSFALISADNYPDLFIGRLSASVAADVTTQVNKILTYERDFTTAQTWLQYASGVASAEGTGDDGEYDWEHMDNIRTDLLGYGYTVVDRVYPNNPPCTAAQLTTYLNGGSGVLNYCGHGNTTSFTTTGFSNTDVGNLTNGVKTPIVNSVACLNGNFVSSTCFAEAWLRKSGGGGIAFYGSSINQSWSPPMAGQDETIDLWVAESKKTVGGLFFNGSCKMLDDYPTSGDMYKTWNIFGDPSMLVRTKNPIAMAVTHTSYMNLNASTPITVTTGVPYSRVCISIGTTMYSYGNANVSGVFTTSLTATTHRVYTVTVTAQNRVTYVGELYAGHIWTGAASNVWTGWANWNCSSVPNSTNDVLIPDGTINDPNTSMAVGYCNNLTLESGANVTVSAYDLRVSGNAKFYGQLNISAGSDLEVEGDLFWYNGSTANITNASAEIYCAGDMTFYSGSNVQFAMGYIEFDGDAGSDIINYSSNTQFYNIRSNIANNQPLNYSASSTQDFVINGSIWNYDTRQFFCYYEGNVILKGSLNDYNTGTNGIKWYYPTLIMDGTSQNINLLGASCYVQNLTISSSATVSLQQNLTVYGKLRIESGVFNAASHTITIWGDWENIVGPAAFTEGTSTVIFKNNIDHQYCNYSENFYNLEVNKTGALRVNSSSAVVTCAHYDWTAGAIDVLVGTFTANDLIDNGLYGSYYVNTGGTINLTNTDGYVDLNGNLIFSGGGTINVFGGTTDSYWPYVANGSITMSGGILDFKDRGIYLYGSSSYTMDFNITGGTIRTSRGFYGDRDDFDPTGGIVELYGSTDATVSLGTLSNFHHLKIDKTSSRENSDNVEYETDRFGRNTPVTRTNLVTATSNLDINGYFQIYGGTFVAPAIMYVGSYWRNWVGPAAFTEGTGLVVFDDASNVYVYPEEFNNLELNKPGTSYIYIGTGTVQCNSYNWTSGKLYVSGGTFTALDLADNGIYGTIELTSGFINFTQDLSNWIDLRADVTISGGEFHVYGGSTDMLWGYGTTASLTMSNGIFDIHDQLLWVYTSAPFTSNITGGTIRVAKGFYCSRNDFNPTGGILEMYSTTDANLNMEEGSLYNLRIDKAARGDEEAVSGPVILTDREGNQTEFTRSNTVTLLSDVSCDYMFIDSGSFNPNGHTLSSASHFDTQGTVIMNNVNSKIDAAYDIYWYPGSVANATLGTFESGGNFNVYSGATVVLPAAVNTYLNPLTSKSINLSGTGIQFGNLYINGSGTVNTIHSSSTQDMVVAGNLYITAGNELDLNARNLNVNGFLDLDGKLDIHTTTASIQGKPAFASTSILAIDSGTFIYYDSTMPRDIHLYGTLSINSGTFEAVNNSLIFESGSVNSLASGQIICDGIRATVASNFQPAGGTVKLTSNPAAGDPWIYLASTNWLPNLVVETNTGIYLNNDALVNGNITIDEGRLDVNMYNLNCTGNINVNDGGILEVDVGAWLYMRANKNLNINDGGRLEAIGDPSDSANLSNSTGYTNYIIQPGGTIAASYAVFLYPTLAGVNVKTGATVDPSYPFSNCYFGNGVASGTLLTLNNNQDLAIVNAYFPTNTWGGTSNVRKGVNTGLVNFLNASGSFAGENYDDDTYDRIFWTTNAAPATPDLQILKAVYSDLNPDLGETVTCTVTFLNASTTATGNCYLDLYWNQVSPPGYVVGDQAASFVSIPAGIPQVYVFNVTNTDSGNAGLWNSWLQLDVDQIVAESNEANNIFGPLNITWNVVALPAIDDLTIERVIGTSHVFLDWTYPVPVTRFNVYRSTNPYFIPDVTNLLIHVTYPTTEYTDTTGGDMFFYIVTAEEVMAAAQNVNPTQQKVSLPRQRN